MPSGRRARTERDARDAAARSVRLRSPALLALALMAFAYIGVENGLTLFAVPWAQSQGLPASVGRSAISLFWSGLMIGRLALAARRGPAPGPPLLVACGAGAMLALAAALLWSWSPALALLAAGLALGPVYPANMAPSGRRFGYASGTAIGLVAGAGACGGFALPWLGGALGDALGPRFAIALLGACAGMIALCALAVARAARREGPLPLSP